MVQFATLAAASLVALASIGMGAISQSAWEEARYSLCPTHDLRVEYKQAERALSAARRGLESTRHGGSLYAAGKLGVESDQATLDRAQARLQKAAAGYGRAEAACRSYVTE